MITFTFNNQQFTIDPNKKYEITHNIWTTKITPLMYLVMHSRELDCDEELNSYILDHRDQLNLQSENGATALMLASTNSNTCSKEITVKQILDAGANINLCTIYNNNVLTLTAWYNDTSTLNTVKMLVNAKGDYNSVVARICDGGNPKRANDAIKILTDAGFDFKIKCPNNKSGFEHVCKFRDEYLVKYCFDKCPYDETELLKCIVKLNYSKLLISYLTDLYFQKVNHFKII